MEFGVGICWIRIEREQAEEEDVLVLGGDLCHCCKLRELNEVCILLEHRLPTLHLPEQQALWLQQDFHTFLTFI